MKIKKLKIRNIASISSADIDFENDFVDSYTNAQAQLILISGDTGCGKTTLLDCITLALYKETPRTKSCTNTNNNKFNGISVDDVRQYTRLGISADDECYCELIFTGNDGKEYTSRLTMGMMKQRSSNNLKLREATWTMKCPNGTELNKVKDINDKVSEVVGLTFEQFNRMVMLAQGQFAQFLCGEKKEREQILEQLTNTEIFSRYGEAISNIAKQAKNEKEQIEKDLAKLQEKLNETDPEQLNMEIQELKNEVAQNQKKIEGLNELINTLGNILSDSKAQEEKQAQLQTLEAAIASEEYKHEQEDITAWERSAEERNALRQLVRSRQEQEIQKGSEDYLKEWFVKATNGLLWFKEYLAEHKAKVVDLTAQIEEKQQHINIFTNVADLSRSLSTYRTEEQAMPQYEETITANEARKATDQLAIDNQEKQRQEITSQINQKETEKNVIVEKRNALNPDSIVADITTANQRKNAIADLSSKSQQAGTIQNKIAAANSEMAHLQAAKETAETANATAIEEAKAAQQNYNSINERLVKATERLNTMKMSQNEMMIEVRSRLQQGDTCPLCGQAIDKILNDNINKILTPLQEEEQAIKKELDKAQDTLRNANAMQNNTTSNLNVAKNNISNKQKELEKLQQELTKLQDTIAQACNELGITIEGEINTALNNEIQKTEEALVQLTEKQKEVEQLNNSINAINNDIQQLNNQIHGITNSQQSLSNNIQKCEVSIIQLQNRIKNHQNEYNKLNGILNTWNSTWADDIDATIQQLTDENNAYNELVEKLERTNIDVRSKTYLIDTITNQRNEILQNFPHWDIANATKPDAPACQNNKHCAFYKATEPENKKYFNVCWKNLYSKATTLKAQMATTKSDIEKHTGILDAYYAATGRTEEQLADLDRRSKEIEERKKDHTDKEYRQKELQNALGELVKKLQESYTKINITLGDELPNIDEKKEELKKLNEAYTVANQKLGTISNMLQVYEDNKTDLEKIKTEHDEAEKKNNLWQRLNSTFGGTRFRTIVQSYILQPLLNNANIYLSQITDRYLLTCIDDNEALSIFVKDNYHKGETRSNTMLSGGERFMISLALSLALSTLNRPDLKVDTLFIDEGFGTLDNTTLDNVMSTLERLQEITAHDNRRVALISHREELMNRIQHQIQVKRQANGSSKVEIKN